jgi:hypothetical protein
MVTILRRLSYRDRDESSTYREMYGVLFIVKTFAARAANSSLLIQCAHLAIMCFRWSDLKINQF